MKTKTVITISRQFGSGGREIAKRLSNELNIPFYDKEIVAMAAAESGIDEATFESEGNKISRSYYLLGAIGYTLGSPVTFNESTFINDRIYTAQSNVINEVANLGACVITGRCADYLLRDNKNVLNIYIHADIEDRVHRAVNEYGISDEDIELFITKIDKQRAKYYNYYTDQKWGEANNYNLTIDTSKFGIDEAVKIIKELVHSLEL